MLLRCGRTVIVSSGQRWATWIAQRLSHNQRPFFASLSHIKLALFQSFSSVLFFVPFTSGRLSWHCLCKTWRVECSSPARKRQRNTSCTWWVGPQTEDVEIAVQNKFFLQTLHMYNVITPLWHKSFFRRHAILCTDWGRWDLR